MPPIRISHGLFQGFLGASYKIVCISSQASYDGMLELFFYLLLCGTSFEPSIVFYHDILFNRARLFLGPLHNTWSHLGQILHGQLSSWHGK